MFKSSQRVFFKQTDLSVSIAAMVNALRQANFCIAGGVLGAAATGGVMAEGASVLEVKLPIELQYDNDIGISGLGSGGTEMSVKAEPAFSAPLNDYFQVKGQLVLEQLENLPSGTSNYFENHGLFVESLTLSARVGDVEFYAGKFNPEFGKGHDEVPGIYGEGISEEYKMTERVGIGISYEFGEENSGTYRLGASIFTTDTSFLSGSLLKSRGQLTTADGGVGNNGKLSSFVISFDADEIEATGGLSFHLAARRQTKGVDSLKEEFGIVAGTSSKFQVGEMVTWAPFIEYAYITNVDGTLNDRNLWTISSALYMGDWQVNTSYSQMTTACENVSLCGSKQGRFQTTVGYQLKEGLLLEAGYQYVVDDMNENHTLGLRFMIDVGFSPGWNMFN